ncbi:group I truncated hemoglobin [Kaarinaea lacus]
MDRIKKLSLFDELGGLATLQKVHRIFYDKLYAHPWLKHFFAGHNQQAIEDRQTAFMAKKLGGAVAYWGKQLKMAHRQMYITEELFDLRHTLLRDSLEEAGIRDDLAQRWLKIDYAFKRQIVKQSIEGFYKTTWKYEKRIIIPRSWCDSGSTEAG